jgi:site-specific recombinase XerD
MRNVRDRLITEIQESMAGTLSITQLEELGRVLTRSLHSVDITERQADDAAGPDDGAGLQSAFIAAKRVEGCSEKSLKYYAAVIASMRDSIRRPIRAIATDDLREFFSDYKEAHGVSNVSIDNMRRILSSFFGWLEDEDYILKSPVRRIHRIRTDTTIKDTLSDEGLEQLRDACTTVRDLAMIDLLSSTGIRVSELVQLDREHFNFTERECVVFGKGAKERMVYFDARTKIHLMDYFDSRTDSDPAAFVSLFSPHKRLQRGGVETRIREIGRRTTVQKVHPHKFRRTLATRAIDKGMPIEQVQRLLGHIRIDTTMGYAMVDQQNVKSAHRKYIG